MTLLIHAITDVTATRIRPEPVTSTDPILQRLKAIEDKLDKLPPTTSETAAPAPAERSWADVAATKPNRRVAAGKVVPRAYTREVVVYTGKNKDKDKRKNLYMVEVVNRALGDTAKERDRRIVAARQLLSGD